MLNLKITKETQGSSNITIPTPRPIQQTSAIFAKGYEFPICSLARVSFNSEKETKRDGVIVKVPALTFVFIDNKKRMLTHIEFPIDMEVESAAQRQEALAQRIKHIWDETIGADKLPDDALEGKTFAEFYENVSNAFNAIKVTKGEGENKKEIPLYSTTPIYIMTSYYKSRLTLPQYPNFVQRAYSGQNQLSCELVVDLKYISLQPQEKKNSNPTSPGAGNSFGGDFSGTMDFGSDFSAGLPDVD